MNIQTWQKTIKCSYCEKKVSITHSDVIYGDLRHPDFFEPDWQFYYTCKSCNRNYIFNNIPSQVAVWIQDNNTK